MKNYNDTLYRITNEQTIEPYLVLYRGKYIPELNEKDKKSLTLLYNEIGPYSFILTDGIFQLWNRETGQLIAMKKFKQATFNTLSNFNYRLSNNDIIQMNLLSINNGKLIFLISPSLQENLQQYLNIKEDDNPVVVTADLKKN